MALTTSCRSAPTARKAAAGSPPTFRSKERPRKMNDASQRGFTLLEMVCVLAIIALLAAVLLPFIPRETSRTRLQAYALQAASLLKADRDAAISRNIMVATLVDAGGRAIWSRPSQAAPRLPADVRFDPVLPQARQRPPAPSTNRLFSHSTSCRGRLSPSKAGS